MRFSVSDEFDVKTVCCWKIYTVNKYVLCWINFRCWTRCTNQMVTIFPTVGALSWKCWHEISRSYACSYCSTKKWFNIVKNVFNSVEYMEIIFKNNFCLLWKPISLNWKLFLPQVKKHLNMKFYWNNILVPFLLFLNILKYISKKIFLLCGNENFKLKV